jgi:hypothetical protein
MCRCAVFEHRLPELLSQMGVDRAILSSKPPHMLLTGLLLLTPGALCWAVDALERVVTRYLWHKPEPKFLWLAYGYMPLVWAATLAHYLDLALPEAGRILPVRPRTIIDGPQVLDTYTYTYLRHSVHVHPCIRSSDISRQSLHGHIFIPSADGHIQLQRVHLGYATIIWISMCVPKRIKKSHVVFWARVAPSRPVILAR